MWPATLLRWIDGDTCEVRIALPYAVSLTSHVRLLGFNAPELHGLQSLHGRAALERVNRLAPANSLVQLKGDGRSRDKYGRILADIISPGGVNVGADMRAAGFDAASLPAGVTPRPTTLPRCRCSANRSAVGNCCGGSPGTAATASAPSCGTPSSCCSSSSG